MNMQHLAARLREGEALGRLIQVRVPKAHRDFSMSLMACESEGALPSFSHACRSNRSLLQYLSSSISRAGARVRRQACTSTHWEFS